MSDSAIVAAVVLGLVFEWSGIAKLASRDAWQVEGTPFATGSAPFNRMVRTWLPWAEVGLGGLLILRIAPVVAGSAAALLLVAFTVALVRVLVSGQRPPCMCFGAVRPRPISWWSVVRNAVLLACAITTIVGA